MDYDLFSLILPKNTQIYKKIWKFWLKSLIFNVSRYGATAERRPYGQIENFFPEVNPPQYSTLKVKQSQKYP